MNLVLDTIVVSELIRPGASSAVTAWVQARPNRSLWITSVTQAEMWFGARSLPPGRKRQALEELLTLTFEEFAGRVWPFDSTAASACADILCQRRAAGRPIAQPDAEIAGIARARGAAVVTRNVADFEGCGLVLHNPWLPAANG